MDVEIDYTNYRGERRWRKIRLVSSKIRLGCNEYHPELQWLLDALDLEKNEQRTFALKDIHEWRQIDTIKEGDVVRIRHPSPPMAAALARLDKAENKVEKYFKVEEIICHNYDDAEVRLSPVNSDSSYLPGVAPFHEHKVYVSWVEKVKP